MKIKYEGKPVVDISDNSLEYELSYVLYWKLFEIHSFYESIFNKSLPIKNFNVLKIIAFSDHGCLQQRLESCILTIDLDDISHSYLLIDDSFLIPLNNFDYNCLFEDCVFGEINISKYLVSDISNLNFGKFIVQNIDKFKVGYSSDILYLKLIVE